MKKYNIEFKKDGNAYRIRVYVEEELTFEGKDITRGTGGNAIPFTNAAKTILLQSHWGSGVTFSDISVEPPPADWW